MASLDRRICSVCAWREQCQKRFITTDHYSLFCPDYTRDVKIRDIENKLVELQLDKWETQRPKVRKDPVITVSRETGSGGSEVARILAKDLKMDLIGGGIISKVAESAKMSTKVVETLDEKAISTLDSWIDSLFVSRHLWPDVYLRHLTKVIMTIGEHGNTVVVGRGAHFILPVRNTLRLRFIAPLEARIRRVMSYRDLTRTAAEQFIQKKDAERSGFIKKYFRADAADPGHYDLVLNTESLGIDGAVRTVKDTFQAMKVRGKGSLSEERISSRSS